MPGYILKYGTYAHEAGEVRIDVDQRPSRNQQNVRTSLTKHVTVTGLLQAADPTALTTAIAALEAAYAEDGKDLVLYQEDGTTPTQHVLRSNESVGGTKVVRGPSYVGGLPGEYVTFRSYQIEVEADYNVLPGSGNNTPTEYSETVTIIGGGPRWVFLQPLTGNPIRQQVAQNTPFQVTQQGRAVGQFAYPIHNPPLFPEHEHRERRRISRESPQREGNTNGSTFTRYPISWSYEFESIEPIQGNPQKR